MTKDIRIIKEYNCGCLATADGDILPCSTFHKIMSEIGGIISIIKNYLPL